MFVVVVVGSAFNENKEHWKIKTGPCCNMQKPLTFLIRETKDMSRSHKASFGHINMY